MLQNEVLSAYPTLTRIRQHSDSEHITDIAGVVRQQIENLIPRGKLAGKRIAVTVGSRGITNIQQIIRAVADCVKALDGSPFIIPAMGSHGGATADGQEKVLCGYGITAETMGCPVVSSMEVVRLGDIPNGAPVWFDKSAYEADGVIVCNRVKPHTDFIADNESGIVKMVAVGLGNEAGCSAMHAFGLAGSIGPSCSLAIEKAPILAGLAVIENSSDETYAIQGVLPEHFLAEDARLLKVAQGLIPRLPTDNLDLLIVKEIGKMFSGTGMDTKVIGRIRVDGIPEPSAPRIKKLVVLRLNPHSYGNALGIGLADITTKNLIHSIDRETMYSNLLPTTYLERGKYPVWFNTEQEAIDAAIRTLGTVRDLRMAVVENTLHLSALLVTPNILEDCPKALVLEKDIPIQFDKDGRLLN